ASIRSATLPRGGSPSWHLVVMRTPGGSAPPYATAMTSSHAPYIGAVSIRSIPASIAAWSVATASSTVVSPHPHPSPPPPRVRRLTDANGPSGAVRMRPSSSAGPASRAAPCATVPDTSVRFEGLAVVGSTGLQIAWGPEEEAFRAELIAFLDAHTPD